MRDKAAELRVGVSVIAALTILIVAILWGKEYSLSTHKQTLQFLFPSAAGLEVGDAVEIAGIKKGRVTKIELSDGQALVSISLSDEVKIFSDVTAKILSNELMGSESLVVYPGKSSILLSEERRLRPLPGTPSMTIGEMFTMVGDLAAKTNHVLTALDTTITQVNQTLGNAAMQEALSQSMENVQVLTKDIRTLVEENDNNVLNILANFEKSSTSLNTLIDTHQTNIDSSLIRFYSSVNKLDMFTSSLNDVMAKIDRGEGSLGKLTHDEILYTRLQNIVTSLDTLTVDLKKNMGRYIAASDIHLLNLFDF